MINPRLGYRLGFADLHSLKKNVAVVKTLRGVTMSYYVKSKSKTGKVPRTGNRYVGSYQQIVGVTKSGEGIEERMFLLIGYKIRKGKRILDTVGFNSQAAAKKAGWVKVA